MKRKIFILVLCFIMILPNMSMAADAQKVQRINEADLHLFIETYQYIKDNYPFEIEDRELIEGGLKGMLQSIDPYSDYYTEEETTELYKEMFGMFTGIGVYIEEKNSYINIKDTIKDSPGEKAGLKKDDLIIAIDGTDTKGMTIKNAQKLIQGLEGTKVKLRIQRGANKAQQTIEVKRDKITINPVEYKILDNKIGYLRLIEFSQNATLEVNRALNEFSKQGITNVILDLRDNGGGLLNQAVQIGKIFVPEGPIVHIQEKGQELKTHYSKTKKVPYKLVVLVNEYSASASEILAGAIKDTKSGILIGKKTFGKGIVQAMIPLESGGMIKLTTSVYLTPNKTSIHGIGVLPDMTIGNTETEDLQLKEAIKAFKN